MVTLNPGEMLRPIPRLIGGGGDRVALHAADITTVTQVIHVDVRHTEIPRAEWAGVNAQTLRINLVTDAQNLGETREPQPTFQDFVRAHIHCPANPGHLRTRRSHGIEHVLR